MGIYGSTILLTKTIFYINHPTLLWLSINLWGSDSTSVWIVSQHLIPGIFSYENTILMHLNRFKRGYLARKYIFHIPDAITLEAIFVGLD